MRTNSWRKWAGVVLGMLAFSVLLPDRVLAQQGGLFPLHPIRRERVPCNQEDPVYKLYRYQYFGYHPTVWRRFPDGWGVPSPEAPNAKLAFEKLPLKPPEVEPADGEEEPGMQDQPNGRPGAAGGAGARPRLPVPPNEGERSPFDMDKPGGAAPGDADAPPARRPAPSRPQGNRSPFDTPDTPATPPDSDRPAAPRAGAPDLAPPADDAKPSVPRTSQGGRIRDRSTGEEVEDGPVLAMPEIPTPSVADDEPAGRSRAAESLSRPTASTAREAGGQPAQAAPRRGRIAGMFSGLSLNWLRR